MSENFIWLVTYDTSEQQTSTGARGGSTANPFDEEQQPEAVDKKRVPIKAEKLQTEMAAFLLVIGQVFNEAEQQAMQSVDGSSKMELNEIELSVEVNAEGQVSLLGSGGKLGGKGAITLKFKRANLQ